MPAIDSATLMKAFHGAVLMKTFHGAAYCCISRASALDKHPILASAGLFKWKSGPLPVLHYDAWGLYVYWLNCILHRIPRALQPSILRAPHTSTTVYQLTTACCSIATHIKVLAGHCQCIKHTAHPTIYMLHTKSLQILAGPLPVLETMPGGCT